MFNFKPTDYVHIKMTVGKHNSNQGWEYEDKFIGQAIVPFARISEYTACMDSIKPESIGITETEIGNGIDFLMQIYVSKPNDLGDPVALAEMWASDYYHGDKTLHWIDLDV